MLAAQLDKLKGDTVARLKADGMLYEERMEILDQLEYPKPLRDFTYDLFDRYRTLHPWVAEHNIAPKSVVRDLYERAMGFGDYVAHYQLARSEGLVLRYLSDTYKALVRTVPQEAKTDELDEIIEWLGELVRQVDSSLIDEWELLSHPAELAAAELAGVAPATEVAPPVTANVRAFRVMVRNACFRRVELAATRAWAALGEVDGEVGWDAARWEAALAPYFTEHDAILTGPDARATALFELQEGAGTWRVSQTLCDPAGYTEWFLVIDVDLAASDATGAPVIQPSRVGRR